MSRRFFSEEAAFVLGCGLGFIFLAASVTLTAAERAYNWAASKLAMPPHEVP